MGFHAIGNARAIGGHILAALNKRGGALSATYSDVIRSSKPYSDNSEINTAKAAATVNKSHEAI